MAQYYNKIKLQRLHGFTPETIKNTAKIIVPNDVQFMYLQKC